MICIFTNVSQSKICIEMIWKDVSIINLSIQYSIHSHKRLQSFLLLKTKDSLDQTLVYSVLDCWLATLCQWGSLKINLWIQWYINSSGFQSIRVYIICCFVYSMSFITPLCPDTFVCFFIIYIRFNAHTFCSIYLYKYVR